LTSSGTPGGVAFLTEMGFSVSVGILIAAFVMSMFLVPSVTALIGRRAWWPGHGDRPDRAAEAVREPIVVVRLPPGCG
jgi:RND superfamily putative drug exporter